MAQYEYCGYQLELEFLTADFEDWTDWEKQNYSWLKDAHYCKHEGVKKKIEKFLPGTKSLRLEGMKVGKEYLKIWEVEIEDE